ncbi:MAG: four helix bundle protein [Dehalococcoidia bacterium]
MRNFRELKVTPKAHALTLAIYEATGAFPFEERFGLTGQLRRAAASIGYNIAEGCGRDSDPDFARFLQIAMGSASEVEYEVWLARDSGYLSPQDHDRRAAQAIEVRKMLHAFINQLRRRS